jgi:hypothetical protein
MTVKPTCHTAGFETFHHTLSLSHPAVTHIAFRIYQPKISPHRAKSGYGMTAEEHKNQAAGKFLSPCRSTPAHK